MELLTEHHIYYSNKHNIPLAEVAESLVALDKIIRHSPYALEKLLPGLKILDIDVFIAKLESGSLWETVLVKFVFGSQDKMEQRIESLRDKLHVEDILSNKGLVAIVAAATILSCGIYFRGKNQAVPISEKLAIEKNINVIINMGSDITQVDPDKFKSIIESSLKGKEKRILNDAIGFLRPATRDPDAAITFNQDDNLSITPEAILSYPKQKPEPEETMEVYENVDMIIRAIDLDSAKRGWAAIIPAISDRRIRLELAPHIDPITLMTHPTVKANVTVLFRETDKGKIPRLIHLSEVVTSNPPSH